MVHDIGTELTQRLDVLAMRGGRYLRTVDRRAASARAVTLALWVSPLVPVGFLAARLSGPVDVMTMLFAALAVPVVALVGGYVGGLARTQAGRGATLALFDHRLGLKDRIVAADEFVAMPVRDGFRGAALHEAIPAVERALTDPLAIDRAHPAVAAVRRRWPFAAAAIVAALLAALLPYGAVSGAGGGGNDGIGDRLARMVTGRAASDARTAAEQAATGSAAATGTATDAARAGDAGPNGAPGSRGAEGAAGDAGATSSTSATGAAGDAAAAADGKARSGANAAAQAGNARTSSAQAGTAAGEPIDPTGAAPADARSTDAATRPRPGDRSNGAPPAPAPGSAAPSTPRRPQQSNEGGQQGQQSRSRKGEEGGASQPGQGNGQGQNGQRSGSDEALKKSRGLSGLLLAVPMQDRLTGTVNDGPVESITRRGTPRPAAAGAAATGARGAAGGAVGRIPHRPATAQERRMLEAYFARGGGTR